MSCLTFQSGNIFEFLCACVSSCAAGTDANVLFTQYKYAVNNIHACLCSE